MPATVTDGGALDDLNLEQRQTSVGAHATPTRDHADYAHVEHLHIWVPLHDFIRHVHKPQAEQTRADTQQAVSSTIIREVRPYFLCIDIVQ